MFFFNISPSLFSGGFTLLYSHPPFNPTVHLSTFWPRTWVFLSFPTAFWFSGSKSGCKHCSEVFSTLMRPGKLLYCIYCGGSSFFLRYFCGLIPFLYIWSLSLSLELPERLFRARRSSLYWYMSDPRRMTLSDQHLWIFICSIIYYGAFSHAFFSSDALLLKSGAQT